MHRFQLEFIYYFTYFCTVVPSSSCFFPVGLSSLILFQQVLLALKFLLSPALDSWQLEFKSLIIFIVGFQYFVCCLSKQWFKLQLSTPKLGDRRNINTHKTCWKCIIEKGLQERNTQLLDETMVEK
jgi:hypothetical protein